jgi:hypothetical protein
VKHLGEIIIIGVVFQFACNDLQYCVKMDSPTLYNISVNKQTIFEGRGQILLFPCGLRKLVSSQLLKIYYWSWNNGKKRIKILDSEPIGNHEDCMLFLEYVSTNTAWEFAMTTFHQRSILKIRKPGEILIYY